MKAILKGVGKRYGDQWVLRDLDLTLEGVNVLMAPSGRGKTTLARLLLGLEQPDSPEAVIALILQGAAARYACCPAPSAESNRSERLTETDWRRFQRAVSHITISQDTEVTLIFTDKKATGKDE